jgi:hypothetical protein
VSLLVGVYPIVIVPLLVLGRWPSVAAAAWVFLACGLVGILGATYIAYKRRLLVVLAGQGRTAQNLCNADASQPGFAGKAKDVFEAFDVDNDGFLSLEEVRAVLKAAFHAIPPGTLNSIMIGIAASTNKDGNLGIDAFIDCVANILPDLQKEQQDAKLAAEPRRTSKLDGAGIMARLSGRQSSSQAEPKLDGAGPRRRSEPREAQPSPPAPKSAADIERALLAAKADLKADEAPSSLSA